MIFWASLVVEDEVFNVVEEGGRGAETVDQAFQTRARIMDLLTVDLLSFISHAQPREEMFLARADAAHFALYPIREEA